MDSFGVDALFTPERPVFSAKGAVVTYIAHIPAALTAVMKLNGVAPDFRARGSLALKAWMANDQGLVLPPDIALPTVEALAPYDLQIAALGQQVGAVIPRQTSQSRPQHGHPHPAGAMRFRGLTAMRRETATSSGSGRMSRIKE